MVCSFWSESLRAGEQQDSTGFSFGESSSLLLKLQHVRNFGKQNWRVWEFVFSLELWRMSKCCVYVGKATRKFNLLKRQAILLQIQRKEGTGHSVTVYRDFHPRIRCPL